MAKASDFKVGQVLWFVPKPSRYGNRYAQGEYIVTKRGTKFVSVGDLRFQPGAKAFGMCAEDRDLCEQGRFWLSEQDAKDGEIKERLWKDVRSMWLPVEPPDHLTADAIRAILAQLRGGAQ